ncbi:MAG: hypothetical protein C0402_07250 [Thermodesulfovibrio sp.]|nr:hypothetical protein [Thermodesulfovibrio sp.]
MKKIVSAACMALLLVSQVWAEEKINIDEIVVTATRADEEIYKISSNVTVITQDEIKKSTAATVQDLLRNEEGLIIRDLYGTGTKSTVDMRGFARGLNTVIMIDGRRLNEIDLSGVDWNTIALENVERIEVVRGSQSVLYGDNAMAGAINIITKKGYKQALTLVLDARAESYRGQTESGTVTGGNDWVSYFVFTKYHDTSGYRANSHFKSNDLGTKLSFRLNDHLTFDVAAGYHKDKQGLPGGLTESELAADRRQSTKPDDRVSYNQRYIDTKANFGLGTWGDLEIGYSYDNREYDSTLVFFGTSYNTKRDTATSGLRAKLTIDKKYGTMRNLLVAGVDYSDSAVANKTSFGNSDLSKTDTGFYLQDEFFISPQFSLSLGYRYADAKFEDQVIGTQKFRENAAKAGLTYNYADRSKLFINYAKGYRLPTTDEIFDFSGVITTLKPERSDTYEAGVVHSFGKRLQARLTAYTMDVKDELFYNPTGGAFGFGANENLAKTRHYGVETGVTASVNDDIAVFGTLGYSDAKFKAGPYDGNHIQLVPQYTASLGADYKFLKSFLLAANLTWNGKKYLDNDVLNAYDKMDSSVVVNAKLSYTCKNLTAYVGINNLFNEKFSEYGIVGFGGNKNFYPAPERNFYGGLRIAL